MVSKNQFQQQNRNMQAQHQMQQQMQHQQQMQMHNPHQQQQQQPQQFQKRPSNNNHNGNNARAAAAPYKKPFRSGNMNGGQNNGQQGFSSDDQALFSSCQMPCDPLYIDFNSPAPNGGYQKQGQNSGDPSKKKPLKGNLKQQQQQGQNPQQGNKMNNNKLQGYNNQMNGHHNGGGGGDWQQKQRFPNPIQNRGGFNGFQRGVPRHMMGPPMGPMGPMGPGPRGAGPRPHFPPMPFPGPMGPMRGAMRGPMGGLPPPPHPFMRRNGPPGPGMGPGPMMGGPPPMHMMGPRMPPRGPPPGVPFGGIPGMIMNGGRISKPNPKLIKLGIKGKSSIKTLKHLISQYPIDKPWVTEEIRTEHTKKVDIENRLKGHKDDELFAQFRVQRDKFVSLYEAAREEYLKQEAASVMGKDAKSDKDKNAISNQSDKDATIPNP
ncbi:hypothetical protein KR009_012179 [Drosophila setifemur]|nr:hypothetical protein KR009_012179 [Drosophila setifemur]